MKIELSESPDVAKTHSDRRLGLHRCCRLWVAHAGDVRIRSLLPNFAAYCSPFDASLRQRRALRRLFDHWDLVLRALPAFVAACLPVVASLHRRFGSSSDAHAR